MKQLITETAQELDLTEKQVADIIKAQMKCVKEGIYNGKTSKLPYIGKFIPKVKKVFAVEKHLRNANKTN